MSYYAKRFFGQTQREGIVTDGLKLWLDASNPASYPGSGTVWYDLSGNGNGTMVNGVAYSTANGGVMSFDGVNDYLLLPTLILNGLTTYTISFYMKINNTKLTVVFGQGNSPGYSFAFTGSTYYYTTIAINNAITTEAIYTITRNGTTLKLYRNDIYINQITVPNNTFPMNIISNPGWPLNGNLNDILYYNRALTPAEITQNFNATKSKYGL